MKFIHIGCRPLNITNKIRGRETKLQIKLNRITVACRSKTYVEINKRLYLSL